MDIVNGFQMKMDMAAQLPAELNPSPSSPKPQAPETLISPPQEMYGSTNVTMGTMYDWMECFSPPGL